jgi:hypothetical protein
VTYGQNGGDTKDGQDKQDLKRSGSVPVVKQALWPGLDLGPSVYEFAMRWLLAILKVTAGLLLSWGLLGIIGDPLSDFLFEKVFFKCGYEGALLWSLVATIGIALTAVFVPYWLLARRARKRRKSGRRSMFRGHSPSPPQPRNSDC